MGNFEWIPPSQRVGDENCESHAEKIASLFGGKVEKTPIKRNFMIKRIGSNGDTTTSESSSDPVQETPAKPIVEVERGVVVNENLETVSNWSKKFPSSQKEPVKIRRRSLSKNDTTDTTSSPAPIHEPTRGLRPRSKTMKSTTQNCPCCNKSVYLMEEIKVDGQKFHKWCFKCSVCEKTLTAGGYAKIHGAVYCKAHFAQLFKSKGNYDEGFGKVQRKRAWTVSLSTGSAVMDTAA